MQSLSAQRQEQRWTKQVNQLIRMVNTLLPTSQNGCVLIIPGMKPWPRIDPEVAYQLKTKDWFSFPLVIRNHDMALVEFVICSNSAESAWSAWIEVLEIANKKGSTLNTYQRLVHNHMIEKTSVFKELLENSGETMKRYIPPQPLLLDGEENTDYNNQIEAPLRFDRALTKALHS